MTMNPSPAVLLGATLYRMHVYENHLSAQTWIQTSAPITNWSSIACSADGSKVFAASGGRAAASGSAIYRSTDSGLTWSTTSAPVTAPYNAFSLACSADGTRIAAVSGCSNHLSFDSGNTWSPTPLPCGPWRSVACSADGTTLIAAGNEFPQNVAAIAVSTNAGVTWSYTNLTGPWLSVCSSADGSRLVVG